MPSNLPAFGVFGSPSIGKSSIVATLTEDDSIQIDDWGGTTTEVTEYRLEVGSRAALVYDTPGFEKAPEVLAWLMQQADSAHQRPKAIEKFLQDEDCQQRFPVETELLRYIMDGIAILYVADDSLPNSSRAEAEMEILRWTGQARMGIINPFGARDHEEEWRLAMRQFFDVVRVFNPMRADFTKRVEVLEAFYEIKPEYGDKLRALVAALWSQHEARQTEAVNILAQTLVELRSNRESQKTETQAEAHQLQPALEEKYRHAMRRAEKEGYENLKNIYNYQNLDYLAQGLSVPGKLFEVDKPWFENWRRNLPAWTLISQPKFEAMVGLPRGGESQRYLQRALNHYLFLFSRLQRHTHAMQEPLEPPTEEAVQDFAINLRMQLPEKAQQNLDKQMKKLCNGGSTSGLRGALRPLLTSLVQ